MAYTLACKDLGVDCNWKGEAKTKDELFAKVAKHAKEVHGYTDEQLKDPEMMKTMEQHVKKH